MAQEMTEKSSKMARTMRATQPVWEIREPRSAMKNAESRKIVFSLS
jgi:hypothetical protein